MSLPAEFQERADAALANLESLTAQLERSTRNPSKAALISGGGMQAHEEEHNFFTAVAMARSRDAEEQQFGKAILNDLGSAWRNPQKATLGDTTANGGYIMPNNLVTAAIEGSVLANPVRELLNTITGVFTNGVDIPIESGSIPQRAVIAARGATKQNVDFTLASYSATFYTLARIHDVGNQFLRNSRGAAEQLVRSKLARAFSLGESYYVLSGSGTSEPKGLLTSLAAGSATWTTAHTASDSTVAGSVRAAVAKAIEALASRGIEADGVLMNPGDLARAMVQGADAAGFWVNGGGGSVGLIGLPGIRIRTSTAVTSKTAVAGAWKQAQLFIGADYRVDVSSEAGTRWDANVTGFRAEEDLAFNGDPYVIQGLFQRITGLIP